MGKNGLWMWLCFSPVLAFQSESPWLLENTGIFSPHKTDMVFFDEDLGFFLLDPLESRILHNTPDGDCLDYLGGKGMGSGEDPFPTGQQRLGD